MDENMEQTNISLPQEPELQEQLPEETETTEQVEPSAVADVAEDDPEVDAPSSEPTPTPNAEGRSESASARRQRALQAESRRRARAARSADALKFAEFVREAGRPVERKHAYAGTLMGVVPATDSTPTLAQVSIEEDGKLTGFDAMIPFSEFFVNDPLERRNGSLAPADRADRERRLLDNSLFARVSFVITNAVQDGDARAIIGSRKAAMQLRQRLDFFGRNPIKEGDIVPADIFAVDRAGHTMWVELGGVECHLNPGQITYRPIIEPSDLAEMGYATGVKVPVYVSRLEIDESTHTVTTLHVSAATAEMATWQRNMSKLSVGMTVQGVITRMTTNANTGTVSAIVWLPYQQCPVRVLSLRAYSTNIGTGSSVILQLTRNNPDDSEGIWFYAAVRQVRPRPSLYNS